MSLSPGSSVGPYEILGPLGQARAAWARSGKAATRAWTATSRSRLCRICSHDEERQRFEREAKVLAQLSHPNIAALLGLEEQDGRRYLVTEHVGLDRSGRRE